MALEQKDIEQIVETGLKTTSENWDSKLQKEFEAKKADFIKEIEAKGYTSKEDVKTQVDLELKDFQKQFDELATKVNKQKTVAIGGGMSFKSAIGEGLTENLESLKNLKEKRSTSANILLKDEDMNFTNFGAGAYDAETTDRTRGMYQYPFSPLWLRSVLPNSSTNSATIQYLRENGGLGEAGIWDGTGTIDTLPMKPGVNFDFELITENVEWIAGITRVKREMLDDVAWLQSYIAQQLTVGRRGLYVAENTQIYTKLTDNSVAYDGDRTVPVERIYDAAFGQLKDNYYNATTILMNHRDVVNLIAFNKAAGSGEYDLPNGTVSVIGNQLNLGGVPVIGVPNIPVGTFIAFDRNATQFVSRMNPEVRFFEQDRDNVTKNLITVRAEERMAVLVFDENAVISGDFTVTPEA